MIQNKHIWQAPWSRRMLPTEVQYPQRQSEKKNTATDVRKRPRPARKVNGNVNSSFITVSQPQRNKKNNQKKKKQQINK